jgi:hypothetical protein
MWLQEQHRCKNGQRRQKTGNVSAEGKRRDIPGRQVGGVVMPCSTAAVVAVLACFPQYLPPNPHAFFPILQAPAFQLLAPILSMGGAAQQRSARGLLCVHFLYGIIINALLSCSDDRSLSSKFSARRRPLCSCQPTSLFVKRHSKTHVVEAMIVCLFVVFSCAVLM